MLLIFNYQLSSPIVFIKKWKIWQWRISCNQYYLIFRYVRSTLFPRFNARPQTPHTNTDPIAVDLSFWLTMVLLWSNHQRNGEMCWKFLDCFTVGQTFQRLSNIKPSFKYFAGNWAFLQHSFNLANWVKTTANKSAINKDHFLSLEPIAMSSQALK